MSDFLTDFDFRKKVRDLVQKWVQSKGIKEDLGEQFEQIRPFLPQKYKESPSNTLYRVLEVPSSFLEKNKSLILENRKYSSWTLSLEAAKHFGDTLYLLPNYVSVILKRRFTNDEIFLNIEELSRDILYGFLSNEREIIVKNIKNNFIFKPSEICYIQRKEYEPWEPYEIEQISNDESSTTTTAYFNYYYYNPASVVKSGVHDPSIFKAFFLAGGGGSGKTFVAERIFQGHGLKFVSLDPIFEKLLKSANIDLQMKDLSPKQYHIKEQLRHKARQLMETQRGQYIANRLGLVLDGTGRNHYYVEEPKGYLDNLGYDTYMVFVDVPLETALQRNKLRTRQLPDDLVKEHWYDVQSNKEDFQRLFGKNFILIDNTDPMEKNEQLFTRMWKIIKKHVNSPVKNKEAQKWIKNHV